MTTTPKTLLRAAALAFALVAALPCAAQQKVPPLPADAAGLLKHIKRERDKALPQAFHNLARIGTMEAFEASVEAADQVKRGSAVSVAYYAFQHYRGKDGLQVRAIGFLHGAASSHKRDEHQLAAARALASFGSAARAQLEQLVGEHREVAIRRVAIPPVIESLLKRDTAQSVTLVLENAQPGNAVQAASLARGLRHVKSEATVTLLVKKFGDRGTSPAWKVSLIDRLATIDSPAVNDLFLELLEHEDPTLAVRAVEVLGARGEAQAERTLWKLLKSRDPTLKRAAIIALGKMMGADEKWKRRLFDLADERDPAARMGAAVALAELRSVEAIERLHEMLEDGDRRVRIEAVQQVGNLRRKDSIPALIERLRIEEGRVKQDVVRVLRLVTGLDNGTSHTRWNAWWAGEGASFEAPPYEDALAAEKDRRDRREANVSLSSFYGLNVVSDRVCFVLDYSGSMRSAAREDPGRSSAGDGSGPTRLKVAQRELSKAVQHFPDGDLFNIVFFESGVSSWKEALVEMKKKAREDAIAFVNTKKPAGGTNVYGGLMAAFADERVDTVYLLTDGMPSAGSITDPGRLRAEVARINAVRKVQINCISVGMASALLRGLAADSGGEYREVGMGR